MSLQETYSMQPFWQAESLQPPSWMNSKAYPPPYPRDDDRLVRDLSIIKVCTSKRYLNILLLLAKEWSTKIYIKNKHTEITEHILFVRLPVLEK